MTSLKKQIELRFLFFRKYLQRFISTAGLKYHCPICGFRFRKLLPYGDKKRPNAKCPVCESAERHRQLFLFFKKFTRIFSSRLTVLHFAPEFCLQSVFYTLPKWNYFSADLNLPHVSFKTNLTALPVKDQSLDGVICLHVLEHIKDDHKALREIFRVLKPGGWLAVMVPYRHEMPQTHEDPSIVTPEDGRRVYGESGHWRLYGRDLRERLEAPGFEVKIFTVQDCVPENRIARHGLSGERIFFCLKPSSGRQPAIFSHLEKDAAAVP